MSVEVRLPHVKCNLSCQYCFDRPQRALDNIQTEVDWPKIKRQIDRLKGVDDTFVLSGGEPLLIEKEKLDDIYSYASGKFESLAMQTNAVLIDEDHIDIFKKHRVSIGVSIDGFEELNDLRRGESVEKTRRNTRQTIKNLLRLRENNVGGGVISTVHRANAGTDEKLEKLKHFILWLAKEGNSPGGNLHMLNATPASSDCCLSVERNREVFLELARFLEKYPRLEWKPFINLKDLIQGNDRRISCIWSHCDPMCTQSVHGLEPDGTLIGCARPFEGFDFLRGKESTFERYISLYQTPQEYGGCKGCKYFIVCGGSCPGAARDNEWRNRVMHCKTIKALFGFYEERTREEGQTPVTDDKIRPKLESWMLEKFHNDKKPLLHQGLKQISF